MKKRLLTLAAFALTLVGGAFAYSDGDYIYTDTQRFKLMGENLIENGSFEGNYAGWYSVTAGTVDAEAWTIAQVEDDTLGILGKNAMQSMGATAAGSLCNSWNVQGGTSYVIMYNVYAPEGTNIATSVTPDDNDCMDFWLSYGGLLNKQKDETLGYDSIANVAYSSKLLPGRWTRVAYFFTPDADMKLCMNFSKLSTDVMVTGFELWEAQETYDVRNIERRIEYIRQVAELPEFINDESAELRTTLLEEVLPAMQEMVNNGELDDPGTGEEALERLNANFNEFLDVTSENLASDTYFKYIDFTTIPKYNRGSSQMDNGAVLGGLKMYGFNWWHSENADFLQKFILGGANNPNPGGSVSLYSNDVPAGKYFVSLEIRAGRCSSTKLNGDNDWNIYYDTELPAYGYVNNDTTWLGTIAGSQYKRLFFVAELKDGQTFDAGIGYQAPDFISGTQGSACNIRNYEVRYIGSGVAEKVERLRVWRLFKAQWDAAVSARAGVVDKLTNPAFPWERDSLQRALDQWDPYYNAIVNSGWISADGGDSGLASNDDLENWANYQGSEIPEDGKATYQVVRGYQNANNYSIAANKPFADLIAEIARAKEEMANDMYSNPNDPALTAAIAAAQATLDQVEQSTSDATREADTETLVDALEKLTAAIEKFQEDNKPAPIVDIDFANDFELVTPTSDDPDVQAAPEYYVIKGAAGEMMFPNGSVSAEMETANTWNFAKGFNNEYADVLHVGGSTYAAVKLPVELTDNDKLEVNFMMAFGSLGKAYADVMLVNAGGYRVAGFSIDRYNGKIAYNDFNDAAGNGMDVLKASGADDKSGGAINVLTNGRNTFQLTIDYKAGTVQGKLVNKGGTVYNGKPVAMVTPADGDNKIVAFVMGSNNGDFTLNDVVAKGDGSGTYARANSGANGRRCWFDDLKIYRFASSSESGISEMPAEVKTVNSGIYTIGGMKVNSKQLPAGLYIINGKKVVVK